MLSPELEPQYADSDRQHRQWGADPEVFPEPDFDILRPCPLHNDQIGDRAN
jgi:hypothetical protein